MTQQHFADSMESPEEPNHELVEELRERLTEAVIKCSERCLYHSAKW